MKEQIKTDDVKKFKSNAVIFTVLLIATALTAGPFFLYSDWIGMIIWIGLACVMMFYAIKSEKQKNTMTSKHIKKYSLI